MGKNKDSLIFRIRLIALLGLLLIGFQNCSNPAEFSNQRSFRNQMAGDGHEGKLSIPVDAIRDLDTQEEFNGVYPQNPVALQNALNFLPSLSTFCRSSYQGPTLGKNLIISNAESQWPNADETYDLSSSLPSQTSLVRWSIATAWDASGVMQTVSDHVPRFEVSPVSGQRSILLEPESKNQLFYSGDLNVGTWSTIGATTLPHSTEQNPMLNGPAFVLAENSTDNVVRQLNHATYVDANTEYSLSIFAKPIQSGRLLSLGLLDLEGNVIRCVANLQTQTVQPLTPSSNTPRCDIQAYPNGWTRVALSLNVRGTTGQNMQVMYELMDGNQNLLYPATGHPGIILWGAQLEPMPVATSYIPTPGAAFVYRRVDQLALRTGASLLEESQWSLDFSTSNSSSLEIALKDIPSRTDLIVAQNGQVDFQIDSNSSTVTNAAFDGQQKLMIDQKSNSIKAYNKGHFAGESSLTSGQRFGEIHLQAQGSGVHVSEMKVYPIEDSEEILSVHSLVNIPPGQRFGVFTLGLGDSRLQTEPFPVEANGQGGLEGNLHDFIMSPENNSNFSVEASLSDGTIINESLSCY